MQDYHEFLGEILIPEDKLKTRVAELGQQISRDYAGKNLMLVCILRGGVMFLTDLMRAISILHTIEFMAISSYGISARESSGHVRINYDLNTDISDRDVLIVEDIVDSGRTLAAVIKMLSLRNPRSLAVCALLDKAERREVDVPIRYQGFVIPDRFVFGYGLDIDDYYRGLPFIGVVDLTKLKKG
jgi:hypoxanthine phosphoribosyltransferase